MKLGDFADILKKNKLISQLQTTGGFAIKSLDRDTLSYIQVENVYERLGYLADNNIVATSECIKGPNSPGNVVYSILTKPVFSNVKFYGCEKDTGFVVNSVDERALVYEVVDGIDSNTISSVLNLNGIKIASIHLPGDGPKDKSIAAFLDENLRNLKSENVDVVCGDTNITDAKSLNIINSRIDDITQYFIDFFGGPCVIINSGIKIGKHRRGFVLRNQQLKKSVPESTDDTEADGTIIAIRLNCILNGYTHKIIENIKILNHNTNTNIENALEFKVQPIHCLDKEGKPVEKVWLDHSVLHLSMSSLCYLIGKEYLENYPRNLIVINMGSIVNAGFKSWNTKYLPYQKEINEADRDIYNIVCKYNPKSIFPNYNDIFGSNMIGSVDSSLISKYGKGVDNIIIEEPSSPMMAEIDERLSRLMLLLGQNAGKIKNRKSRIHKKNSRNRRRNLSRKK